MKRNPAKCIHCHEPVIDDGYGDIMHADGLYHCNNDKGTFAETV